MGEVGRDPEARAAVLTALRLLNPKRREAEIVIYADALADYHEAQANIHLNGAIVFHPRTGAPIDNPYLRIRDRAAGVIRSLGLRADPVWGVG